MPSRITDASVEAMLTREKALFLQRNPKSGTLAEETARHWLRGVPMHWMVDWGTPFPLFIQRAAGVDLTDADGNTYVDFCLGDTGAMFGHSPPELAQTLRHASEDGFTTMLPSPDAAIVGRLLTERFGLPFWQVTATASDANRSTLRWCRAITGRKKILVFNGCYHGAVDETFVGLENGQQRPDPALIGEPRDLNERTKVVEFMCSPDRPRNGGEAGLIIHRPIDMAIHHYLLNRGVVITPFHNMMLICPATTKAHVETLIEGLDHCLAELV